MTFVKVTVKLPILDTVMLCCALVVPVTCELKTNVVGVTARVFVGVTPVPDRLMTFGLPGALCVMVNFALREPAAAGVNATPTVEQPARYHRL